MINAFFAEVYTTNDHLVVVVEDGQWTADPGANARLIWLYTLLMIVSGGHTGELDNGIYHFNMKSDWFKMQLTLIDPNDPYHL